MLTCDEVAVRLRITVGTVYEWLRKGKLAYVQVGARKLIPEEALSELIEEKTVNAKEGA